MTHTFEIGKTYTTRSISNSSFFYETTIISKTEKSLTAIFENKVRTYRIKIYNDTECFYPDGKYANCPVFFAKY